MRAAKVKDAWRKVYLRNYASGIERVAFSNVPGLGSGTVQFGGGIAAICGANGVGKTALLGTLLGITKPDAISVGQVRRLDGSVIQADLKVMGNPLPRTATIGQGLIDPVEVDLEVTWIDCPSASPDMIEFFADITNLNEQLEAEGCSEASPDELSLLSYVVGKTYSSSKAYELEFADRGTLPYFVSTCDGATYGSETMGLGELSVHFVLWHLKRAAKNSLVLIEEPETFIAPRSQEALVNVLAQMCAEKGIWAVLTTHSPQVLSNIPPKHVRYISRVGNDVRIVAPENPSEYFLPLGMAIHKSVVMLVEDRAAREFASAWIGHEDPFLGRATEVKDVEGGASKIWEALMFPQIERWLKIVGLLDGDARHDTEDFFVADEKSRLRNWPFAFLPGEVPPELLLMNSARSHVAQVADRLGRGQQLVHTALGTLEGKNYHDWLDEFHKLVDLPYGFVVRALFDVWITDPDNARLSRESFDHLCAEMGIAT